MVREKWIMSTIGYQCGYSGSTTQCYPHSVIVDQWQSVVLYDYPIKYDVVLKYKFIFSTISTMNKNVQLEAVSYTYNSIIKNYVSQYLNIYLNAYCTAGIHKMWSKAIDFDQSH